MLNAARSVHLWFPRGPFCDCYLRARVDHVSPGTYFAAIGFQGGYFGIQEKPDKRHVGLFSLWHDGKLGQRSRDQLAWAHRIGDRGFVRDFGGEGEGLQSYVPFDWRVGNDIGFRLTTERLEGRTCISAWLADGASWRLVSSLSRAGTTRFIDGWYAFVEDFRRDGHSIRERRQVTILDAWARQDAGQWRVLNTAKSTADNSSASNFDVRIEGGAWVMETGGEVANTVPLQSMLIRPTAHLEVPPMLATGPQSV